MIPLHKTLLSTFITVLLLINASSLAQSDEKGLGQTDDGFYFDVDEIKFPEPKLLRP